MLASCRSELLRFRRTARIGAVAMSALIALVTIFAFTGVEPTPQRGGQAPTATSLDASLLLAAPDVAMTEAAIGSGLTTFLFFFVLGRVRRGEHDGHL